MTEYIRDGAKIQEALDLVQEECAEIIQIISKIRRFGFKSYSPYDPDHKENQHLLNDEIGDLFVLIDVLAEEGIIDSDHIAERMEWKKEKLRKYTKLFS